MVSHTYGGQGACIVFRILDLINGAAQVSWLVRRVKKVLGIFGHQFLRQSELPIHVILIELVDARTQCVVHIGGCLFEEVCGILGK